MAGRTTEYPNVPQRKPTSRFTVKEKGRDPVVIEVKIDEPHAPNLSGEAQAREHLGKQLVSYERVTTAMALRLPHRFRHTPHRELAGVTSQSRRSPLCLAERGHA